MRVVDEKGEQLGVVPIGEALFKARQAGLDLVEVAPEAKPPVCKIINFKKFKYQEDKKARAGSKKSKQSETKEVRFTPFIAQNDFDIRVKRAKEFLEDGDKVRLSVKFLGRQITRRQFGYDLLNRVNQQLKDITKVESEPKWQGRILMMVLAPIKK